MSPSYSSLYRGIYPDQAQRSNWRMTKATYTRGARNAMRRISCWQTFLCVILDEKSEKQRERRKNNMVWDMVSFLAPTLFQTYDLHTRALYSSSNIQLKYSSSFLCKVSNIMWEIEERLISTLAAIEMKTTVSFIFIFIFSWFNCDIQGYTVHTRQTIIWATKI